MAKKYDGGPAFPCPAVDPDCTHDGQVGMSLRDWFAGKALAGMLARPDFNLFTSDGEEINTAVAARNAYQIADAMLAESRK